jgi:hypothetical protein
MSLSGDLTRQLITIVLERGQKFGLDVAGSFLGPAWPVVRPLVEKLIDGLPERIASGWKNNDEALQEVLDELEARQDQVDLIGEALAANGIDADWASGITEGLSGLSDDIFEVLCNQADAISDLRDVKEGLAELLASARSYREQKPANLVLRGSELEFVDLLRVPNDFLPRDDLSPTAFAIDSVPQRHMPAGFMVWNFSIFNEGQSRAVVNGIELIVAEEGPCPPDCKYDQLKPTLDPVDDRIELQAGEASYLLFRGRRFGYAPDEFDAFRVQILFVSDEPPIWQRLRPVINWSDATGDHATLGTELFIASHPSPEIERARLKFGIPNG